MKSTPVLLLLILLLAFALRLPGVFWGVDIFHKPHFVEYHPDEGIYSGISEKMLSVKIESRQDHAKGFSFQMALVSYLIRPIMQINEVTLTLIGRVLSVIFGVLTIGLVYFLSKELFHNAAIALFSSLLLALSGVHVTQSHQSVPDAETLFWWYAAMYFSLIYSRTNKNNYLFLACLSAGLALAVKLSVLALVPIIYVLIKKRSNLIYWLLAMGGIFLVFWASQGGHYGFHNFMLTLQNARNDNLHVINIKNNKWWNPLIYLVGMPPALGLANLILLIMGIFLLRKRLTWKILHEDYSFILLLPLALQVVVLCCMDITTSRHFLPLVPLLAMIAAYALNEIRRVLTARRFVLLLAGVILYQLVYVAGVEYYFVFDPRDNAARWIRQNIPAGKSIYLTTYTDMFDFNGKYKIAKDYNSDYLVLHERYYLGYIRYKLHPLKNPYPAYEEIIHANRMDFEQIQKIFKGESSFKLIKLFPMLSITPESLLYKKLWGNYVSFIGDTLIFQKGA